MRIGLNLPALALVALATAGCNSSNPMTTASVTPTPTPGTPAPTGGSLPIKASGKLLAVRLPSSVTSETDTFTDLPVMSATPTATNATDRTAPGGIGFTASVDKDPDAATRKFRPENAALVTAAADAPLQGGTELIGLDKARGNVYFQDGNFGDPQASSTNAAVSAVGIYNLRHADGSTEVIKLKDATTVRYRDGNAGDAEASFAVGYAGNPTAAMPGAGKANYKGFYEQGIGVYTKADGSTGEMYLRGETELSADFAAGTMKGGIKNGSLMDNNGTTNLNAAITGLEIDTKISGSEYAGTATLVGANGAATGTTTSNQAIGGFFGENAAETATAFSIEGNAQLDGKSSDYVLQGTMGAVRQ